MYVRLAFAVAAHLEPEILLVDEVLAVGDVAFQKKCLGKMGDVAKEGRTVLFVSHNMGAIARLCKRVFWLESGQLKLAGLPSDVVGSYLLSETAARSTWTNLSASCSGIEVQLQSVRVLCDDHQPSAVVRFDRPFQLEIKYRVIKPVRDLSILCRLTDSQGNIVWTVWDTDTTDWKGQIREPGTYLSICKIPAGLLRPGRYLLSVGAHISNVKLFDYHENVLAFDVSEMGYPLNPDRIGIITPLLAWEIKRTK